MGREREGREEERRERELGTRKQIPPKKQRQVISRSQK
jgi:hypothetical protein